MRPRMTSRVVACVTHIKSEPILASLILARIDRNDKIV